MSDVMLFGVLRMPYEMAMGSELSRRQFYARVQELADRFDAAPAGQSLGVVVYYDDGQESAAARLEGKRVRIVEAGES